MDDRLPPEALLTALLKAMDTAGLGCTVIVNQEGTLRRAYANAPLANILGVTVEELERMPPLLPLTPEERQRLVEMQAATDARMNSPRSLETKITRPDGSTVPVEVSMGLVPLEVGHAVVAFLRDLSPRLAMEAALRESEERFRVIAEASPDGITMFSEGRYVYANPVAMRLLGITSQEELTKVDPLASVPEDRRAEATERGKIALSGETRPPMELHRRIDGRDIFLEASIRLATFAGRPAIVSYSRDITERKELQARLMQQDRLAVVGTLAAGLAHELNNPLTYLAFHLKRLNELTSERPSGEEVETLAQIEEGTRRMKSVISDLLFLTRSSDSLQAHVDLRQILLSTLSLVRTGTTKASPRIETDLAETGGLLAHPSRLGQVFLNVILNAIEAVSHREDGLVRVSLRERGPWLEVTVVDNGVGIPPEGKGRVFDPFFTTKPEGTGLGLFISHAIVSAHGGTISLESAGAEGACVTIRLPKGEDA